VNDIVFVMKVIKSKAELAEPGSDLGLGDLFIKVSLDVLMEITLFCELKNQHNELFLLIDFLDLDNVWMGERKEQSGFEIKVIIGKRDFFHGIQFFIMVGLIKLCCQLGLVKLFDQINSPMLSLTNFANGLIFVRDCSAFRQHERERKGRIQD
jgi:hypothetical protein